MFTDITRFRVGVINRFLLCQRCMLLPAAVYPSLLVFISNNKASNCYILQLYLPCTFSLSLCIDDTNTNIDTAST